MKRRKSIYGKLVALASLSVAALEPAGTWNTLAYEVDIKARDVKLTREVFEQCVRNFAAYPKVPIVIEHADTEFIPNPEWASPQGHVTELRVGTFTRPDGRVVASLEGRIVLDPRIREAVLGGKTPDGQDIPPKWAFGSVTIFFDMQNEEFGTDIGAVLWSFSLTSHNALVDLPRIAASRSPLQAGYWYGDIDDKDDMLSCIKSVLDLPVMATEQDVLVQLDKLASMLNGESPSDGVDLECIVNEFRDALRLPALATNSEVIQQVRKALEVLPSETSTTSSILSTQTTKPTTNNTQVKTMFLTLAKARGFKGDNEEEAKAFIEKMLQETDAVRSVLQSTSTEQTTAQLSKLAIDAARGAELALQTAQKEREEYVADVMELERIPASAKSALMLEAETNFEAFQKNHPRPSKEELAQHRQDPMRLARLGNSKEIPQTSEQGQVTSDDLLAAVEQMMIDQGISYEEAIANFSN